MPVPCSQRLHHAPMKSLGRAALTAPAAPHHHLPLLPCLTSQTAQHVETEISHFFTACVDIPEGFCRSCALHWCRILTQNEGGRGGSTQTCKALFTRCPRSPCPRYCTLCSPDEDPQPHRVLRARVMPSAFASCRQYSASLLIPWDTRVLGRELLLGYF